MHACGHDCHMAMLLGAVKILNEIKMNLMEMLKYSNQQKNLVMELNTM